jgi:hypothetical protein
MYNKYTIALYAAIVSSMLVASIFAISYVQQAAAQGNQTSAGGGNKTGGGNQTGGGGSTSGKMTGAGPVTGGATSGSSK